MKRFFISSSIFVAILSCLAIFGATANAQLLTQNFSSSTTVSDYVSATPNNGQFNSISSSGTGTVVSVNNGTLQFARTGNAGTFSRTTDFAPTPTSLIYKVDIAVSGNTTATTSAAVFQVGSAFTTANSAEANASTYARFAVNFTATNGTFQIRDITNGTNSASFSGIQTITWVLNNSGASLSYTAPDGTQQTVANDTADLYVGTTLAFNDVAVQTATQTLTDLKFSFAAGTGTINLDNFLIDPVVAVVANPTVNLSVSSNTASETNPAAITVTATASSAVVGAQTVDLAVTGTGITSGDYTLAPTTITIANGATTGTATFTIVDDTLVEGTETATITENNPSSGITLGTTTTQNITITDNDVAQTAPTITSANNAAFTAGMAGSFTATATGSPAPTFTLTGTVPTGVSITSAGVLTSTTATPAGTYTFNIVATNGVAPDATQSFTLTVNAMAAGCAAGGETLVAPTDGVGTQGAVKLYVSTESATAATVDTQDDAWRANAGSGATFTQAIAPTNTASTQTVTAGSFSYTVSTRELATVNIGTSGNDTGINVAPCMGTALTGTVTSNNTGLQSGAPRPTATTLPTTSYGYSENLGGGSATAGARNALLFQFGSSVNAFGAWFGDVEGRNDANATLNNTPVVVRLFDSAGNRIGNDFIVNQTASAAFAGDTTANAFGDTTTRWIGFVSTTPVSSMMVIVGDDSARSTTDGGGLNQHLSFAGATFASNVTAADSSASGRVVTAKGQGIRRASVRILDTATGETRSMFTSSTGAFNFSNLETSHFFILSVNAKRYTFEQSEQGFQLFEDNNELIFKANR